MTNNNLYVILPIEMFASKKDEYTAKANWDKGSARYNLAGTKVLVEESPGGSLDGLTDELGMWDGGNGLPYN